MNTRLQQTEERGQSLCWIFWPGLNHLWSTWRTIGRRWLCTLHISWLCSLAHWRAHSGPRSGTRLPCHMQGQLLVQANYFWPLHVGLLWLGRQQEQYAWGTRQPVYDKICMATEVWNRVVMGAFKIRSSPICLSISSVLQLDLIAHGICNWLHGCWLDWGRLEGFLALIHCSLWRVFLLLGPWAATHSFSLARNWLGAHATSAAECSGYLHQFAWHKINAN